MKYYQVKKEFDNKPRYTIKKGMLINDGNIYIGGELYTEKEVERLKLNKDYMVEIECNSKNTYIFFGARLLSN